MRSHHPRRSWRLWTLGLLTLGVLAVPHAALAQVTIDPTATPVQNNGGWVYWMAQASIAMGALLVVLAGAAYLRFAPKFHREAREAQAKSALVPAEPAGTVRIQYTPPPQPAAAPVAAPEPAAVAAPAAAPAATAPAPAPEAPAAEAPAAAAAAPRPSTPKQEGPLELDQETFDRVLQEQLDKGTDRRVAEGRARSAAAKAARAKAGG